MPILVANNLSVAEFEALKQGQGDVEGGNLSLAGPGLEWEDVSFHVGETPILDKVSGSVAGGSVCAILGPSGAGKSSLLNVLAGRNSTRGKIKVTAYVEVGGQPVDPVSFRRNVAYVMQDDALIPTATPREALAFSASLRLGDSVSEAEKSRRVEKMLDELGLTGCADVLIGGEMIKGISGGQRKRTSVGIELVTRPKIVFLDEPTSGLDSDSALSCIKLLKSVASKGATVLCTIHQPSSEVFDLFDMVMLLKDGKIMYQGPTGGVVDFFTERGYAPPAHHNPADFMMTVATREPMDDLTRAGFFARPGKIVRSASGNSLKEVTAGDGSSGAGAHAGQSVSGETIQPVEASFGKQLYKLLERELVANKRDTAALAGRFGITIFLNTLFGLIFANAGARDAAKGDGLSSHFGAIVMVTIGSMFGTAQPVMLGFPLERPIFLREYTTGTYSCLAYFLSKGLVEVPLAFVQQLVTYMLVYPMLDLQGDFFQLVAAAWALGIASSSVAIVLGCAVPDVKAVAELAPAVFVPQMLFAGFFVRISQIPLYLRWAQYLCALKYCLNLILIIEFKDCTKTSDSPEIAQAACNALLDTNDVERSEWRIYIAVLAALFLGFRLLGSAVLIKKAESFY